MRLKDKLGYNALSIVQVFVQTNIEFHLAERAHTPQHCQERDHIDCSSRKNLYIILQFTADRPSAEVKRVPPPRVRPATPTPGPRPPTTVTPYDWSSA